MGQILIKLVSSSWWKNRYKIIRKKWWLLQLSLLTLYMHRYVLIIIYKHIYVYIYAYNVYKSNYTQDFDETLICEHTGGHWRGSLAELTSKVRPFFKKLVPMVLKSGILIAIVTFSGQVAVISSVLHNTFGLEVITCMCILSLVIYLYWSSKCLNSIVYICIWERLSITKMDNKSRTIWIYMYTCQNLVFFMIVITIIHY